jgi:Tfp pilus assembly protein FimT
MRIKSQYLETTAHQLEKQKQQARSTAVSDTGIMGLGLLTTGGAGAGDEQEKQ